jgi:hypothetical protein
MLHLQHQFPPNSDTIRAETEVRGIGSLFEISAYETSASDFFGKILQNHIDLVLDVRLKNESRLCGFTKKKDLAYFVPAICGATYIHDLFLAPEPELLDRYLHGWIRWEEYARRYRASMEARNAVGYFQEHYGKYSNICLVGTATRKRRSHSEVLSELLQG